MFTAKPYRLDARKLFSWQFLLVKLLLLALVAVAMEKPSGSLEGRIAIAEKSFGLHTYDVRANKVYVVAEGPREGDSIERGVWVHQDGTFKFDHLPVGEYQIRVRAKGFASANDYGLFVEEGKATVVPKTIAMEVLEPSVSLAQTSRVFTSQEKASMFMNVTGGNNGDVKLYKMDFLPQFKKWGGSAISCSTDLNIYKANQDDDAVTKTLKSLPVLKDIPVNIDLDWTDAGQKQIEFGTLPKGDYMVSATVEGMGGKKKAMNITWFSVSDVGMIVKRDSHKVILRAINLVTLKPVKDCVIRGYSNGLFKYTTPAYKTNADGIVELSDTEDKGARKVTAAGSVYSKVALHNVDFFVGKADHDMAYGGSGLQGNGQDVWKNYFYTDKPIYRLGQTVNYKGICRQVVDGAMINPGGGRALPVKLEDPSGNEVWRGTLTTNKHGAFKGTFTIPADGSTGAYQLVADDQSNTNYGAFEVDQYRKPEFQVEVTSLTPRVVAGQKGRAQVKASYFFGAPVANARVSYSIYSSNDYATRWRLESRPSWFSFYDSWDNGNSYGSGGSLITQGTTQTDENGLAVVEYDTKEVVKSDDESAMPRSPYENSVSDKQYRCEAEVTDISRMTQVGSGNTQVTAGDFALFVQPDEYVVKTGDNFSASVQATNYDGTPVKNQPVTVKLERWTYDSVKSMYINHQTVATVTCTSGADGKATASFKCKDDWPSDTFYVTATAKDSHNDSISDNATIWVASESYAYMRSGADAEKEAVSITTDKQIYKPGETAKVMITAPVTGKEGIEALVTVEGDLLYQYKVVPLDATAKLVEIPLSKDLAPNAFINVTFVGNKHQFYTAEQMIKVSPENNFLKLAVASDKDKYKPGETVHYTITATKADGSPAPNTEVSLGVVDESIYAIRAEQAEDITKFFYTRRENSVATSCTFPVMYSAGPDKIEPKVRKDFRDTAAWMPELVTNEKGIAVADVKLPDNLTTWRATVRGVSMATDVGSSIQKIVCTQDFILRLALPRFFNEGDQGYITAIVHNYTKLPQAIKLTLKASDQFTVETPLIQSASVAPEKAFRYSWPVTLAKAGTGVIEAKAVGQTAGDAMQTSLPVHPLGMPAFSVKSGLLTDENASVQIPVGMSSDAVKGTEKAVLTLASSSIGPVLGNYDTLINYPYGCTEQTLSRLVPSMVAMQLHKRLNLPISNAQTKLFADVQKLSLEKLRKYHHGDGGWGWWEFDDSNPYLTSHVVAGLSLLKETGYSAEDQMINSGLNWLSKNAFELQKQLMDPKLVKEDIWYQWEVAHSKTDLCKMVYTVSQWGVTPAQMLEFYKPKSAPVADKNAQVKKKVSPIVLVYHSEVLPYGNIKAATPLATADAISTATMPETTTPDATNADPTKAVKSTLKALKGATSKAPPCAVRDWLMKDLNSLSQPAICYLVLANRNLGDVAGAKKAYDKLVERSSTDAHMMNWENETHDTQDYRFTGVEMTALGLRAVLAMEPENTERVEGIKQWLLLQRGKDGWENTKTTAEVFMALLTEELHHKSTTPTAFEAKVVQSGQQLFDFAYTATNMYGAEQNINYKLTTTPSTMNLTKTGPGRLYYTTALSYFRKLLPGDQIAGKGLPEGLTITRKFFRLKPIKDAAAADGSIHFRSEEITDHQIKAGETIMMRTIVNSPVPLPYVKVESALPSGAEVVKNDSRENANNPGESSIIGDWDTPWWTHEDVLDDRIVYFGAKVPRGESTFHTMLRMELPGKVEVLPTTLEAMYSKKIRGYSSLDQLMVKE